MSAISKDTEWFSLMQKNALAEYDSLEEPTRKDEHWRFGNIKQLDFSNFPDSKQSNTSIKTRDLPEGVICLPLEEAIEKHPDLVRKYLFQNEVKLGSEKYAALHRARMRSGLFLYLPEGVKVPDPIEVNHVIEGDECSIFPHTLIVAERNSEVSVLETFSNKNNEELGLCIAMNDLVAQEGAKITYCGIQELNLVSRMMHLSSASIRKDGTLSTFMLNTGAQWARNESISRLGEPGASCDMLSYNLADGTQQFDQRTYQHHMAPNTQSNLLFKNTLYSHTKTIFSGLILVDQGAHNTDAYQTCRNLMMSDTSEANSMPGLEINADQVKCSHGSTVASISDEEIFYLRARGIHPDKARRLIAHGFSSEVVKKIQDPDLEEKVFEVIERKFNSIE